MVDHAGSTAHPAAGPRGEVRVQEPTAAQRAVVRRSAEARATVPELELRAEVDMGRCLAVAEQLESSTTALVVRTAALALREVPEANGAYRDGRFELYSRVNVGVVVATDEAYLVPTVFDADEKDLPALSHELEELVIRARDGTLASPALSGATFTVWDVGGWEVTESSPLVGPLQAAALAAGAIRSTPVIREGAVVPGRVMTLTLACDHRILYGEKAARFLRAAARRLEAGEL